MSTYWEKLLDIVDRTRDKIFFFSANRTYVVMSLDHYELLLEQQNQVRNDDSLESINKEVALLKAKLTQKKEDEIAEDIKREHLVAEPKVAEVSEEDQDSEFHIEPVEIR